MHLRFTAAGNCYGPATRDGSRREEYPGDLTEDELRRNLDLSTLP